MEYVVYFYYNKNDEIIYVGLSTNCYSRTKQHKFGDKWFSEVSKIGIREYPNHTIMSLCEKYYIVTINPKYNKKDNVLIDSIPVYMDDKTVEKTFEIDKYLISNDSLKMSSLVSNESKTVSKFKTIRDYANDKNVSQQAIYNKIRKHKKEFKGHVLNAKNRNNNKMVVLDNYALNYLDSFYSNTDNTDFLGKINDLEHQNEILTKRIAEYEKLLTRYSDLVNEHIFT